MRRYTTPAVFFLLTTILLWSCNKEPLPQSTPALHMSHTREEAAFLTGMQFTSTQVSWSTNGWNLSTFTGITGGKVVTLGQIIFYDKITGLTNINCATCHSANATGLAVDPSAKGGEGLVNTRGGRPRLTSHPVSGIEDGDKLIAKMSKTSYYPQLFKDAYGDEEITADRISEALVQYMAAVKVNKNPSDPHFTDPFK